MATKKAGWTAKNLRDSPGQRLGVKLFGGQSAKSGNVIVRQRGTKWHPGTGVQMWKDFTIFAVTDWVVQFTEKKQMKFNWRIYKDIFVNVVTKVVEKAPAKKVEAKVEKKEAPKAATKKAPAKTAKKED